MIRSSLITPAALLAVGAASAQAQVASALLREGDALPSVGTTAGALNNTAVNQAGGWAVTVTDSSSQSVIWGTADGVAPADALQVEGTILGLTQTSFESFFGLADDGTACYSASGTGGPVGGFDSVWLGDVPIAVEGDPTGFDANFWRFASRPGVTAGGVPYFNGGVTSVAGGNTENRGLYFGDPVMPVMQGGDAVPGLPFVLDDASTVDFDYRFSANGTRLLAPVQMESGSTADDGAMTLDVAGLVLGGTLVREGNVIPASVGGDGVEAWDNFDFCGVTEAGAWFFTGDTDGDAATDEFVVVNGAIVYREGDTLDGRVLTGAIEGGYMNEGADLALVWDVETSAGAAEALFVNGQLVLEEGDPVDWDGDGAPDANTALVDFTGISALTVAPQRVAYFTADVDVGGTVLEGVFALAFGDPPFVAYCAGDGSGPAPCACGNESGAGSGEGCANSTGFGAVLAASGTAGVGADDLVLTVSGAPPFQNGIVYAGDAQVGFTFGDGVRCAGGNVIRFPVEMIDGAGSYSAANVASFLGVSAGDVRYVQGWYRDPFGPCGGTFNLSNALQVTFQP